MALPRSPDSGPSVADLMEESVHLLRKNPRELAWYYAGTGPFAVGLLYFWAYVTWFAPPDGEVAAGALLLAGLFGWMKAAQHRFAQCLLARRLGEESPRWTRRRWFSEIALQLRLQASGIIVLPLSAVFAVPFGWAYCYYQSIIVLPEPKENDPVTRHQRAWQQMQLWPMQNHWALAIMSALWLMVFLNVAATFYAVPMLATQWFGLKTIFAFSGWSYLNSTFVALVVGLTHLLVDPLIKTFYLLRVFHGEARQSGVDLRLVLTREKILRRRIASGAALIVLLGLMAASPLQVRAATESVVVVQAAPVPVLDGALNRVLDGSDFRWRLRPLPIPPNKEKEGVIQGFVRSSYAILKQMAQTVARWFKNAVDWVSDLFPNSKDKKDNEDDVKTGSRNFDWMGALQLAAYVLLMVVALLLVFVAWKVWKHNRVTKPLAAPAPVPAGTPDLRDETVEASRLPSDGWLDLARKQIAAGEWRLALRALFLATLAHHAQQGWLSLAKFKTNLDYEMELRRRAHSRALVVNEFRDRRRQFEEVWYGSVPASDTLARHWLEQMEARS